MSKVRNVNWYRNRVQALRGKEQPAQRSEDWYKSRNTRITASEAASCLTKSKEVCGPYVNEFNLQNYKYKPTEGLSPYENKEEYIIKKCSAFFGENVFRDTSFTLHGKKYEEIANTLYAKLYKENVYEFGLISHGRLKWLGASPDGITESGVMLEIKCPKARKIDETAPTIYYWIQVQIQLEVCDLDECDFFECEIQELENEKEFVEKNLGDKQDKGLLFRIIDNTNTEPKFIYPPVTIITTDDFLIWKQQIISENPDLTLVPTYYFVSKYNNIRIKRSKEWFASVRDDLRSTWVFLTRLQENKDDFLKYKESIHLLKSKKHLEKWEATECIITDDEFESFVYQDQDKAEEMCLIDN